MRRKVITEYFIEYGTYWIVYERKCYNFKLLISVFLYVFGILVCILCSELQIIHIYHYNYTSSSHQHSYRLMRLVTDVLQHILVNLIELHFTSYSQWLLLASCIKCFILYYQIWYAFHFCVLLKNLLNYNTYLISEFIK